MPTAKEIQDYLNGTGQNITEKGQNLINEYVDQPAQNRIKALNNIGNKAKNQMQVESLQQQLSGTVPSYHDTESQNSYGASPLTPDGMLAYQAARQKMYAKDPEPDDDMTGYTDYKPKNTEVKQTFPKVKAAITKPTPDIRDTMTGVQEVTPELMKKLGYEDDDEDLNNKAGSAEGSYGP